MADCRESRAIEVTKRLRRKGAHMSYADPYVPDLVLDAGQLSAVELTVDALATADAVVVLTPHAGFDLELVRASAPLVLDTRATVPARRQRLPTLTSVTPSGLSAPGVGCRVPSPLLPAPSRRALVLRFPPGGPEDVKRIRNEANWVHRKHQVEGQPQTPYNRLSLWVDTVRPGETVQQLRLRLVRAAGLNGINLGDVSRRTATRTSLKNTGRSTSERNLRALNWSRAS